MARIVLAKGNQENFLKAVKAKTGLSWDEIADLCEICPRSLRDWRREKYKMSLEAARELVRMAEVQTPIIFKIISEHWSTKKAARVAGFIRMAKYGNPGTPEGRRKGGLRTQELRRLFPEKYPRVVSKKKIKIPQLSPLLAELVGIMLGDGHVSNHQVLVYVNSETDAGYELFVRNMISELFGIKPTISLCTDCKVQIVRTSSVDLVKYLNSIGLARGNKVEKQVGVPHWVFNEPEWMKSCLRGLWDTDGCIYQDKHTINDKKSINPGMTFANRSLPLLSFVQKALLELGYTPRRSNRFSVFLRREKEIHRYFREIGTNNPKHWRRFQNFFDP